MSDSNPNTASQRIADDHLREVLAGKALLVQDGAMGTMLQRAGLSGRLAVSDLLCIEEPDEITAIHRQYVEAGAEMVMTNTFNSNRLKLEGLASVEEVYAAAVKCARAAGARYVAGDIGPTGALLKPMGTMPFEEAYEIFAEQAVAAEAAGCDVIAIETMSDLLEAKVALLAAKENTSLPVFVTMTFEETGRTFLGTPPEVAAIVLPSLGADAVGANCSLGPKEMLPIVEAFARFSSCPVIVRPNAGLPRMEGGITVYDLTPEDFGRHMAPLIDVGATVLGSCCGSDPRFTQVLSKVVSGFPDNKIGANKRSGKGFFAITSAQKAVVLEEEHPRDICVIGERINPTGNKKVKVALSSGNTDYLAMLAVMQEEAGADALDVNVGMPELNEPDVMTRVVDRLQMATTLPLCIDSSNVDAIKRAARIYPGKPLVNSVTAEKSKLDAVLPVVKKYGCAVIGLTINEDGVPKTSEKRIEIAERILDATAAHGIPKDDILIDCLTMPASTEQSQTDEILKAIAGIKTKLGVRTTLGVSNISFGLPARELLNSVFLANALGVGLDAPIINPNLSRYKEVVASYKALTGQDGHANAFIEDYADWHVIDGESANAKADEADLATKRSASLEDIDSSLSEEAALEHAILTGQAAEAKQYASQLLNSNDPLMLINNLLIPTLDEVGARFEAGALYLPQLLACAEATKAAFDVIKETVPEADSSVGAGKIILATVKGDVHDIGKNIVKMLLENYGYNVIDLGKDVEPEEVVEVALSSGAKIVGLSALMTTTVPAMRQTIELLREKAPHVKTMVGGAVLTAELAESIGSDFYAKDAIESAKIAESIL